MLTPHTIATLLSAVTTLGTAGTGTPATQGIAAIPGAPVNCGSHAVPDMQEVTLAYRRVQRATMHLTSESITPATRSIVAPTAAPMGDSHAVPAKQEVTVSYNSGKAHPPKNNQPRMG